MNKKWHDLTYGCPQEDPLAITVAIVTVTQLSRSLPIVALPLHVRVVQVTIHVHTEISPGHGIGFYLISVGIDEIRRRPVIVFGS